MMILPVVFKALGYACLAFSIIGFIQVGVEFWHEKAYTLSRAIIYSILFGIGLALL